MELVIICLLWLVLRTVDVLDGVHLRRDYSFWAVLRPIFALVNIAIRVIVLSFSSKTTIILRLFFLYVPRRSSFHLVVNSLYILSLQCFIIHGNQRWHCLERRC